MMQFNVNLLTFSQEVKSRRTGELNARLQGKKQAILSGA
jgi:hypothetical protein